MLIVDEALSVGDAYFSAKSFDRIRAFRKAGTTLLIVSYDKQAIQSICDRVILLDSGRLAKEGYPESVMDLCNALIADRQNQSIVQHVREDGRAETVSGTREATVADLALLNEWGQRVEVVDVGEPVTLEVEVAVHAPIPRVVIGYMIKDRLGQPMFWTNTHLKEMPLENLKAGERVKYRFEFSTNLGPGAYPVATALVSTDTHLVHNYEWRALALVFNVLNQTRSPFVGCNWIDPIIEIARQ